MQLSDAIAHWWVLDDDHRARRREATIWSSTGHAAAVYGDELYDILPQTRGGYGRLQDFGIRFGYERVVLHLEPQVEVGPSAVQHRPHVCCCSTTSRCHGLAGARSSPPRCPTRSCELQERAATADCVPRQEAIRQRVSAIMPLYQLSRYRPARPPRQASIESPAGGAGNEPAGRPATRPQARRSPPAAEPGDAPRRAKSLPTADRAVGPPENSPMIILVPAPSSIFPM